MIKQIKIISILEELLDAYLPAMDEGKPYKDTKRWEYNMARNQFLHQAEIRTRCENCSCTKQHEITDPWDINPNDNK